MMQYLIVHTFVSEHSVNNHIPCSPKGVVFGQNRIQSSLENKCSSEDDFCARKGKKKQCGKRRK